MTDGREVVFVYGTLRRGASNHWRMEGAEYVGKAVVRGRMYRISWYPGLGRDRKVGEGVGAIYGVSRELLASLERPHGRMVEFLLDHGIPVYPINPKSLDRARDRYRPSGANDDWFDAFVLGNNLRVDHMHLRVLRPDSDETTELRMLTRDRLRLTQQRTRCLR